MRGPIDYVIVGFEGNKFDGSILKALGESIDKGIIKLISLSLVARDENDEVISVDIASVGDEYVASFVEKYQPNSSIDDADIEEVADLIQKNCSAGLLVVEHVWAVPLKQAISDAGGVLIADGRIHSDAYGEITA